MKIYSVNDPEFKPYGRVVTGLEAAKAIIGEFPDANIVMVSSLAYDDTMDTAEEIGAKGFVFKPFEKDDLLKVLNDAVKDVPDAE